MDEFENLRSHAFVKRILTRVPSNLNRRSPSTIEIGVSGGICRDAYRTQALLTQYEKKTTEEYKNGFGSDLEGLSSRQQANIAPADKRHRPEPIA
jgi:hypothetical protein